MIARVWHGWTSRENADAYETLLDAQRTQLETSQLIGMKGLETGLKLLDLNKRKLLDLRDTTPEPRNGAAAALEL